MSILVKSEFKLFLLIIENIQTWLHLYRRTSNI